MWQEVGLTAALELPPKQRTHKMRSSAHAAISAAPSPSFGGDVLRQCQL